MCRCVPIVLCLYAVLFRVVVIEPSTSQQTLKQVIGMDWDRHTPVMVLFLGGFGAVYHPFTHQKLQFCRHYSSLSTAEMSDILPWLHPKDHETSGSGPKRCVGHLKPCQGENHHFAVD